MTSSPGSARRRAPHSARGPARWSASRRLFRGAHRGRFRRCGRASSRSGGVYARPPSVPPPRSPTGRPPQPYRSGPLLAPFLLMSLVLDIGQGAGLAGATGVRPFLPPLLAGALARGDIGLDFDGSGWQFLESPAFLLAVVALAVAFVHGRTFGGEPPYGGNRHRSACRRARRAAVRGLAGGRGSLRRDRPRRGRAVRRAGLRRGQRTVGARRASPGRRRGRTAHRLRRRCGAGAGGDRDLRAARRLPGARAAFAVLLVRGRGQGDRKYAGLRILR